VHFGKIGVVSSVLQLHFVQGWLVGWLVAGSIERVEVEEEEEEEEEEKAGGKRSVLERN
jgi:hypothetical protein